LKDKGHSIKKVWRCRIAGIVWWKLSLKN